MAAGEELIAKIAAMLSPTQGLRAFQAHKRLEHPRPSTRAVRYALAALVTDGTAYRMVTGSTSQRQAPYYLTQRDGA